MKNIFYLLFFAIIFTACNHNESLIPDDITDTTTVVIPVDTTPVVIIPEPIIKGGSYLPVASLYMPRYKSTQVDSVSTDSTYLLIAEPQGELLNGLLAYYPFYDGSTDESPNGGHDGKILNGKGEIVTLNNPKDSTHIQVVDDLNDLNLRDSLSLCAWFRSDGNSSIVQGIAGKSAADGGTGYSLHLSRGYQESGAIDTNDAVLLFAVRGNGGMTRLMYKSDDLKTGWHHVVGTYLSDDITTGNSGVVHLYVDGILVAWDAGGVRIEESHQPFYIGRESGNVDCQEYNTIRYFFGAIDNVMLYNRSISADEVQKIYNLKQ